MSRPNGEYKAELDADWAKKLKDLEEKLPNMTLGLLENALIGAVTAIDNLRRTASLIDEELSKREALSKGNNEVKA